MEEIHLHKDYNTTWCGEDASHLPMTKVLGEVTCSKCLTTREDLIKKLETERDDLAEKHEELTSDAEKRGEEVADIYEQMNDLTKQRGERMGERQKLIERLTELDKLLAESDVTHDKFRDAHIESTTAHREALDDVAQNTAEQRTLTDKINEIQEPNV